MTTKFEDALNALENSQNFKEKSDARIYLRQVQASHEALLKAAKYAKTVLSDYDALPGERDIAIDGMARSIRAAEELSK